MAIVEEVRFDGLQQAAQQMDAFARASGGASTSVVQLTTAGQQQTATLGELAAASTAFTQRIAGVANSIQALVGQFGGQSHTAGLIGAMANTSAQAAQLGAALGPEGAIVGGIVGAVIPAIHEWITANDAAATSLRHLQEQTTRLHEIQTAQSAQRQEQVRAEVASGHIQTLTLQEVHDQRQLVQSDIDRESHTLAALNHAQQVAEQSGATETQGYHARAEGITEAQERLQSYIRTLGNLGTLEAQREAEAGRAQREGVVGTGAGAPPPRARTGGSAQTLEQAAAEAQQRAQEAARIAASQYAEILEQQNKLLNEQTIATHALETEKEHEAQKDAARATAEDERQRHVMETQQRSVAAAAHAHAQQLQETQHVMQQHGQEVAQGLQGLISNLTNVFTLMANGSANAAQGAELMLGTFLSAVSQMAEINALRSAADAVMAASEERWDAFATGIAAAALWAGVAVATGVGGAAVTADAQASMAASKSQSSSAPASPSSSSSSSGAQGGGTTVININSAVPMTQAQATQVVRPLRRMLGQSEQRYPGG